MTSNIDFVWSSFWPIWIKYCGVRDEFEMLKSKWSYFSEANFSTLPQIDKTFYALDNLISETDDLFKPMLERAKLDKKENFDADLAMERTTEIQDRLIEFTMHVGLLKFVFFQRMVSSEIPHIISGLPLSPERTVGNEAIYIAADNVAQRYYDALRLDKELGWDGAISFVYPIQGGYFGGFNRPSKYTKRFHISLTEEGKNFLGSYLLLAHEFGHSTHYFFVNKKRTRPTWFRAIWGHIFWDIKYSQQAVYKEELHNLYSQCKGCTICNYIHTYVANDEESSLEYEQCIADLFAFIIGGPTTCFALVDILNTLPWYIRDIPVRPAFLSGFLYRRNERSTSRIIKAETLKMKQNWISNIQSIAQSIGASCLKRGDLPTTCFDLLCDIGEYSGMLCGIDDLRLFQNNSIKDLDLPLKDTNDLRDVDSITSTIVKEPFKILPEEEERIKQKLQNRITCNNEDLRKILHCYYLLHREGKTPDYATTLCSLAFNKK